MGEVVSSLPAKINLEYKKGDHIDVLVPIQNEDGDEADTTGFTLDAKAVGRTSDRETAITATFSGQNIRLQIAPAETALMDELSDYDVRAENGDESQRMTLVAGRIYLAAPITPD